MRRLNDLVPFGFSLFDDLDLRSDFFNPSLNMHREMIKTDIKETDASFVVEAELPGYKKEDINLNMTDGTLTISVNKNEEKEEKKDNYVRRERVSHHSSRSLYFDNVDDNAIKAKYENGILVIELPKMEKKPEKKGIIIE